MLNLTKTLTDIRTFFISDAISENVRNESRGQIYASPDFNMRNNFERPTNQHVSFHPETRTPEDNLTWFSMG